MAKAKSKFIYVYIKSIVTGHRLMAIKPRVQTEKIEVLKWDPIISQISVYKEDKKFRSAKR